MTTSTLDLLPGTEVHARGLRWEVVSSQSLGPQTLFRLRGLENAVLGHELDVLHPFETIEPIRHDLRPERAAPLVNWLVYHQAFLLEQALGPDALLAVQPGRLRIEPYQLVPVLRAIRMVRVRLLLCDGVGLGKTCQTGLVLTELTARRLVHRILIVSPAGPLLEQWKVEMSERFGLRMEVIDRAKLEEIRRSTELGSNPFDHIPLGLVSVDFLKQERVLEQLDRASYDAVVIDEAHHCMDVGGIQDREDSLRRRLAEVLARRSDCLILATATPHDGNDRSFASLCELLDPSLVDGRGQLRAERYRPYVVRRLKNHIVDPVTKLPLFKERRVLPIAVKPDSKRHAKFIAMQKGLMELIAPELRRAFHNKNYADVLAFIALLKRSVSSVEACKSTLSVVADRFQGLLADKVESEESRRQRRRTLREYLRKQERFGTVSKEEEDERTLLEAEDLAQQLAQLEREIRKDTRHAAKVSSIVEKLEELIELASDSLAQDPKLDQLIHEIESIRQQEPKANVLIYTEYVDSQRAAVAALKAMPGIGTILTMSGDDNDKTRQAVTQRFREQQDLILVSTDSAAEGLNLHQRCHQLIHMELPFNPNRLEQRNGRIDRYGQQYEPIVRYFFLRGTFEDRILLRLIAKYEKQRARLTFVPNTLGLTTSGDAAQARLLAGIMDEDTKLFREEPTLFDFQGSDEADGADPATKELLEEIDRSLKGFEQAARTNTWLGEAGLNAEEKLLTEANEARAAGNRVNAVDLAAFVCDAVQLDGGQLVGQVEDDHFQLRLPSAWRYGLEYLPGYDPEKSLVRLTTKLEITTDEDENPVGFLGRAHPLVPPGLGSRPQPVIRWCRRTIARPASQCRPCRRAGASVALYLPGTHFQPGRARIGAGTRGSGRSFRQDPGLRERRSLVAPGRPEEGHPPHRPLEEAFRAWAPAAADGAQQAAAACFRPIAEGFASERKLTLQAEQEAQQQWLAKRAEEITGRADGQVQLGLLDQPASRSGDGSPSPAWWSITDPEKRLAAFGSDGGQPPAKRSEADGVLRIHEKRKKILDALLDLGQPQIVPLGVLMLIPEANHAV